VILAVSGLEATDGRKRMKVGIHSGMNNTFKYFGNEVKV
jgi:hypothetical protein